MKIAFIVQPDWFNAHFGVRNLFVSCYKILEKYGYDIDFVFFKQHGTHTLWYRHFIEENYLKSNVLPTTLATKKKYKKITKKSSVVFNSTFQFIGNNIDNLYNTVVFTNPWLINIPLNISPLITKAIICYDCVANELVLNGDIEPAGLGFMHQMGYMYAKNNDVVFLSISDKTDKEMVKYYNPERHYYLPPVPTYAFMDIDYNSNQQKENAIILAAPFDIRKGLKDIPKILNALKDNFDTLYIYGTPRCGKKLYDDFYKELKIKNVIHYDNITSNDLIALYKKCKVLLFPSLEEGLGMPIIEAQLCGCRVVTTDKAPMNELLCKGNYLLTSNFDKNIEKIKKMLLENNFDYMSLANDAKEKFSTLNIYNIFKKALNL